ncbi:hypothetical protein BAY61_05175 [Prauserella marina]|nr:hypothetical protein BAY61_05175 [Prauserella marina]
MSTPAESERHDRCWLAWPARYDVWGELLPAVRDDIALLARTIARYEQVLLLARPEQAEAASVAVGRDVKVVPIPVDDLWIRDTGPTFALHDDEVVGVDFGFNGWGGRQSIVDDQHVARRLLDHAGVRRTATPMVIEQGGFEVDGAGTALATRGCLLNPNRNPGATEADVERELAALLGIRKVVWLDGAPGLDITDCHVDGLARFVRPGVVLVHQARPGTDPDWERVTERTLATLSTATDADGRPFTTIPLPEPGELRVGDPALLEQFVASYVNYYVAGGAVLMTSFGDRTADDHAAGVLCDCYPGRDVVALDLDVLMSGGGGIHCATRDEPA